jgi:hypothetical protein
VITGGLVVSGSGSTSIVREGRKMVDVCARAVPGQEPQTQARATAM